MDHITPAAVDSVTVTTIMDNRADLLAATTRAARRATFEI